MSSDTCHLTYEERCQIYALKKSGLSAGAIAVQLKRHRSTIYRELKRNRGGRGYRYKQAQGKAVQRRREASSTARKMTGEQWSLVEEKLDEGWSPEQVSGRLAYDGQVQVSPEWIYHRVREDRRRGGRLYLKLRQRGKKRRKGKKGMGGRGCIVGRVDIGERPLIVEEKKRGGDWEVDTIVGVGHRGAVVSAVDRVTKYVVLERVMAKTAAEVGEALCRRLDPCRDLVHTITADNGKEFAGHAQVSLALGALFFFARPYHSWERGLNEHTNGLVREYFPKSTDFRLTDAGELGRVERRLNRRPRKGLGWRTPEEAFLQALQAAGEAG